MHTLSRKGRSSASRLLHEKNVARRRHAGDGGAPEGDGRASRRAPRDAAAFGKRACAEASGPSRAGRPRPRGGAPLPEGPLAGRATLRPARLPGLRHTETGSGHIPKIQSLSDTPTGKGFQSQPPSGGRKSRRDALSANNSHRPTRGAAANPPSPPSQASPPPARGAGRPLAHIGGAALRTGTGPGAPEASAKPRPPPPARGAAPRALPGKGTAATCRTASGFRPRPLP